MFTKRESIFCRALCHWLIQAIRRRRLGLGCACQKRQPSLLELFTRAKDFTAIRHSRWTFSPLKLLDLTLKDSAVTSSLLSALPFVSESYPPSAPPGDTAPSRLSRISTYLCDNQHNTRPEYYPNVTRLFSTIKTFKMAYNQSFNPDRLPV